MGVEDLIQSAVKRRQPTTSDILTLSSGGSLGSSASTKKKSSTAAKSRTTTKKSSSGSSGRAKAPCKYGPRGADGYCPKKPPTGRARPRNLGKNRTSVTARTTGSATTQAIDVVTNPKATTNQKAAAVGKVAETAASSALKSSAKRAVRSGKFQKAKAKAIDIAKNYGPSVPILGPLLVAAQTIQKPTRKAADAWTRAEAAVKEVERRLAPQKLTRSQRKTLLNQHASYFLNNP